MSYPPPGQPWGPPPPPPRKRRRRWPWVLVAVIVGIIVISVAASSGGKDDKASTAQPLAPATADTSAPTVPAAGDDKPTGPLQHAEDVAILSCGRQPDTGWGTVRARITNHSSKPSNYVITVAFESADGRQQFGSTLVAADALRPGQTTVKDSNSLEDAPAGVRCRLTDVTRYAA